MKKLIYILCLGLLLGACASVSNVESDNYETGKKPTLTQIHKNAELLVAALEDEEKMATLNDEEKEFVTKLKNWDKEKEADELKKYADRPITSVDILTIGWAHNEGYTMEEIDKFLKLGLYVKNPYCENEYKSYEVFQVLPDFVLANGCEVTEYNKCNTINSKIFMFPKQKDELYFDQKILTPPSGTCSTYVGVFEYESKNERNHVVPVLVFAPKVIDKEQLENIRQSREESQKFAKK